jgi:ABC-type multidrug transport system ATPase subunit
LTGYDPTAPKHRYTLETAVLGARLLGWPDKAVLLRQIGYLPGELAFPGRERASELLRFFSDARGGVAWTQVTDLAGRLDLDLSRRCARCPRATSRRSA